MKLIKAMAMIMLIMGILAASSACTEGSTQSIQGILENIDTVDGQITVVTKDGQTHIITIDSKTRVTIDGQTIAIEALDPGTNIEIELEDDRPSTARVVEARLAKIEGTVAQFQNGELAITPEHSRDQIRVKVESSTRIELEEHRTGAITDLKTGTRVEVKYDPETDIALKVNVDSEEEADIEGTVTQVDDNQVTIRGGKEQSLTLTIDSNTKIENGTVADIKVGAEVEVEFDPVSLLAYQVELKDREIVSEDKEEDKEGSKEEDNDDDREVEEEKDEEMHEEEGSENPPLIPHTLQGREDCLACHGENGIEPFPADHVGRSNDICTACHQPSY